MAKKSYEIGSAERKRAATTKAQRAAVLGTTHKWEWTESRIAICMDCGLHLRLIPSRGPRQGTNGWIIKAVWGGNENGIGGTFEEPFCRGPAGGRRAR